MKTAVCILSYYLIILCTHDIYHTYIHTYAYIIGSLRDLTNRLDPTSTGYLVWYPPTFYPSWAICNLAISEILILINLIPTKNKTKNHNSPSWPRLKQRHQDASPSSRAEWDRLVFLASPLRTLVASQ